MNKQNLIKVAVIGPESTGKSNMTMHLSNTFSCLFVPEFARAYCSNIQHDCTIEDELNIFNGQLAAEEQQIQKSIQAGNNIMICDTTIITVKVWCEYVFNECPSIVQKEYDEREYDLYLLLNNDVPWEDDPLRNFPDKRDFFFDWYEKLMIEKNANYRVVKGVGEERFKNAEKIILELFPNILHK